LRPCPCPACREADQPEHGPQPAPAEEGLLCKRDGNRLYKWLTNVLDDTARLDVRIPTDYGWDKEGGHHKVTGSPALVRLDVAALTDRRSTFSTSTEEIADYPENNEASWERLITCPWVDEFYQRMHEIRAQLDQAHNVERPKPMGECFTCNAALYSRPGCTDIRCHKCGRRYNGLDIVKLEVQRRREANA
jgi:hypothetical protein